MRQHTRFEWDKTKARLNQSKHGVEFEEAMVTLADVFFEQFHVEQFDERESNRSREDRWITTASNSFDRTVILRTAWTERVDEKEFITRVISSRDVSPRERSAYEKEIRSRREHGL